MTMHWQLSVFDNEGYPKIIMDLWGHDEKPVEFGGDTVVLFSDKPTWDVPNQLVDWDSKDARFWVIHNLGGQSGDGSNMADSLGTLNLWWINHQFIVFNGPSWCTRLILVGGLEHCLFSIYWES